MLNICKIFSKYNHNSFWQNVFIILYIKYCQYCQEIKKKYINKLKNFKINCPGNGNKSNFRT